MGRDRQLIRAKIFMSMLRPLTMVSCCKFKKNLFNLWLYTHLFMAVSPRGQNFDVNHFSLRSFATSLKKISFKFNVIQFFFHDFIHVYTAPGQGLTTPWGWNYDVNRNILSLQSFVASFKKSLRSLILYIFFHDFIYVYSPGAGADRTQGTKFWFQQECPVTLFICQKLKKKNVFEVWI